MTTPSPQDADAEGAGAAPAGETGKEGLGPGDFHAPASSPRPTEPLTPVPEPAKRGRRPAAPRPAPAGGTPPQAPRRIILWLMMLACLAAACPPLLLELGEPDPVVNAEARALATSGETWRAGRTGFERLVPYRDNSRELEFPPAVVWSHLAAFAAFGSDADTPDATLRVQARLVSVAFALLTLAAVFWAGHSIGGSLTAVLAALVCAANPVFLFYGRLADGSAQQAALTLLAIAAALWAIRPLRPAPSVERQFIGWVVSGVACGLAIYTAGPWTILHVVAPVVIVLLLVPGRVSHLLGLTAALLIGVLMVGPWCVYAYTTEPAAAEYWLNLFVPHDWTDFAQLGEQAGQRTALMLLAMLPWTLWLICGLLQPFSTSSVGSRLRLLLGWSWFMAAVVLVVLSPWSVAVSDQMVVIPAGAVLIGQLFSQYAELAAEGRYARLWRWFRWLHLTLLLVASIALPVTLLAQHELQEAGWLVQQLAAAPPWYLAALAIPLLLLPWAISARWTWQHHPARVLMLWALWTLLLCTALVIPLATGPLARS